MFILPPTHVRTNTHRYEDILKKLALEKRLWTRAAIPDIHSSSFKMQRSSQTYQGACPGYSSWDRNLVYAFASLGCADPSEPFPCPQSKQCIALQFLCDGNPGDCPGNYDENEELCTAGKRDALPDRM